MKKGKEVKISYWAAHATTIVTVSLVLLIIGMIALIGISARRETTRIRESLEISVVMADSVSDSSAAAIAGNLKALPYCRNVEFISKAKAMEMWKMDTGEDLEALFGVNPLSPEISFTLPESYSARDSIAKVCKALNAIPGVESVATPESAVVDAMNSNIARLSILLGAVAVAMLLISFVLINNTVHLTIYARRFIIHTMQLVGATNGFIRRPIVLRNMYAGLLAGLVAAAILAVVLASAPEFGFSDLSTYIPWEYFGIVAVGLVIAGGAICAAAALIATSRYLNRDYHQLVLAR